MTVRLITRASPLALWQAHYVADLLRAVPGCPVIEIVPHTTVADVKTEVALTALGGKNLFVKELQEAVLQGKADFAVHSVKDLGVVPIPGLLLGAICAREDARDAYLSKKFLTFGALPEGACVGTSSPRRACQLKEKRPDLHIELLRGNVGTRLAKLDKGQYDAIILAMAGLIRLGLVSQVTHPFSVHEMIPAIGQGAIGIECRADDTALQALLLHVHDDVTGRCVRAERAFNAYLGGDCFTPLAAHATCEGTQLHMAAMWGDVSGTPCYRVQVAGSAATPEQVGESAAKEIERLRQS